MLPTLIQVWLLKLNSSRRTLMRESNEIFRQALCYRDVAVRLELDHFKLLCSFPIFCGKLLPLLHGYQEWTWLPRFGSNVPFALESQGQDLGIERTIGKVDGIFSRHVVSLRWKISTP